MPLVLSFLFAYSALAGVPDDLTFEVASVRLSGAQSANAFTGEPGTPDPERIRYARVTLNRLVSIAYGVQFDQVSGPAWLDEERYDITAKVPPNTTKEQVRVMWRNLLAERFHLALHTEKKTFQTYKLTVSRNGLKLKPSDPGSAPPAFSGEQQSPRGTPVDGQGFTILPPGKRLGIAGEGTILRLKFRAFSMPELIDRIGWPLGTIAKGGFVMGRIADHTDLTGRYDFTLEFRGWLGPGGAFPPPTPDGEEEPASDLFHAMERQLGLKLETVKAPLDILVIDRVDRKPVEN